MFPVKKMKIHSYVDEIRFILLLRTFGTPFSMNGEKTGKEFLQDVEFRDLAQGVIIRKQPNLAQCFFGHQWENVCIFFFWIS